MSPSCSATVRVRYAEVDRLGTVNSARYFEWFEFARSELLRRLGMPYGVLEQNGFALPVIRAECIYLRRIGYDEIVRLDSRLRLVTHARLEFSFSVYVADSVLAAEGVTEHAVTDMEGRPRSLDEDLVRLFEGESSS